MDQTIEYYNQNAASFSENTQNVDMHLAQNQFLRRLPEKASILDFGCGVGRDTRYDSGDGVPWLFCCPNCLLTQGRQLGH